MGKNLDINNIFSSYMDNVLLKEAVKPTEGASQADKDPKFQQAKSTWEQMTGKKFDDMPSNQKVSIFQNVLNPAAQKGYLENPSTKERTPISSGTAATPQAAPNVDVKIPASLGGTGTGQPAPQAASTPTPSQPAPQSVTAQMPTTSQDSAAPNVDVTIPASLGGTETSQPAPQTATQAQQQTSTQPEKQAYSGGSIVDYLSQSGKPSDFASRKELATKMGIPDYKGTASQNLLLLNALKGGKTEIPTQKAQSTQPSTTAQQPAPQKGMGGIVGGASKVIGGAGQLAKQATIGTKKPLGGILGGISKGIGAVGKGVKTALVGNQEEEAEEYEENCEECGKNCEECEKNKESALNKITVQEKVNISKFLKHLSEKNYSSAHKYLKAIVDDKIKTKIAQRIAKI